MKMYEEDIKRQIEYVNQRILKEDAYELYYWTYGPIIFRGSITAYLLDQFIDHTLSKISAFRKKYGGRMGFLCQKVRHPIIFLATYKGLPYLS